MGNLLFTVCWPAKIKTVGLLGSLWGFDSSSSIYCNFIWWGFLNRAFVEFSRNPVEGFKILPAVYLSVKMLQLKIPLELNVHYQGDIERQLQDVRAVKSLR